MCSGVQRLKGRGCTPGLRGKGSWLSSQRFSSHTESGLDPCVSRGDSNSRAEDRLWISSPSPPNPLPFLSSQTGGMSVSSILNPYGLYFLTSARYLL